MEQLIEEKRLWWGEDGSNFPRLKTFLKEVKQGVVPSTWWTREFGGDNQGARREIRSIFSEGSIDFETVKPTQLLKRLLEIATPFEDDDEEVILDFFAGSGTTAHAVFDADKNDGGKRRFIVVQIPEKTEEGSEARKAGYKSIADITKERIRRVIKKIRKEVEAQPDLFKDRTLDLGFRVFTLEPSNFKVWRTDVIETEEELKKQMQVFVDPVCARSEADDMAWEILLKSGYELTTPLEKIDLAGVPIHSIAAGELILILETVTQEAIGSVLARKPQRIICLDRLFAGNDQLKTNTVLQMKDAGVEFRTI